MAGIAGIISKSQPKQTPDYDKAFRAMLQDLAYSPEQLSASSHIGCGWVGNVLPHNQPDNTHFQTHKAWSLTLVVEGLVFLSEEEKQGLMAQYDVSAESPDYDFLPFLYHHYGEDMVHHLTGQYNMFVYDALQGKALLLNDRLGYLPLYYYEDEQVFVFASRLNSLLACALLPGIEIDEVSITEHLLFNYVLSDHTYIRQVQTLSDATCITFANKQVHKTSYWDVQELFDKPALNPRKSFVCLHEGLRQAVRKFTRLVEGQYNFSLTGGWDSRVVLSYLLADKQHKAIQTYSFGAKEADDIVVPAGIAAKEKFAYTPYVLDQHYLDHDFLQAATETIVLSGGTRNYKRAHYLHAIKQITSKSPYLLSGIFGDEVFKVGKPQGGSVIAPNAVRLLELNFDEERFLNAIETLPQIDYAVPSAMSDTEMRAALQQRLAVLRQRYAAYKSSGQRYFAFRFTCNLRKYFGAEVNSYNDFVYGYSPFIDHDFLTALAQTRYMASRYPFQTPKLQWKAQSTWLYHALTKRNKKCLTTYPSSRGFSMQDATTLWGMVKIGYYKILQKNKRKKTDGFNTAKTDELFQEELMKFSVPSQGEELPVFVSRHDYHSLQYWVSRLNIK